MWAVNPNYYDICMAEGDYGVALCIKFNGVHFGASDSVSIHIKASANGEDIVTKIFNNIDGNTIMLELTSAESALLPSGTYVYRMDWHQDGEFMCSLVPRAQFKVVDKV